MSPGKRMTLGVQHHSRRRSGLRRAGVGADSRAEWQLGGGLAREMAGEFQHHRIHARRPRPVSWCCSSKASRGGGKVACSPLMGAGHDLRGPKLGRGLLVGGRKSSPGDEIKRANSMYYLKLAGRLDAARPH